MKTPTRTAAEFRRMYSTAEWDARIEPDGSVWLTIPGDPILMEIMLDKASGAKGGARL